MLGPDGPPQRPGPRRCGGRNRPPNEVESKSRQTPFPSSTRPTRSCHPPHPVLPYFPVNTKENSKSFFFSFSTPFLSLYLCLPFFTPLSLPFPSYSFTFLLIYLRLSSPSFFLSFPSLLPPSLLLLFLSFRSPVFSCPLFFCLPPSPLLFLTLVRYPTISSLFFLSELPGRVCSYTYIN